MENEPVGSDSTKDPDVRDPTKDPVVDGTAKDVIVDETLNDPVACDSPKNPVVNDSEKKSSQYRPKPKKKKKKKGNWNNNKKIKWSPDTKPASFPTHLLPPKIDPRVETTPVEIAAEIRTYLNQAHVEANTVQVEDVCDDEVDDNDADYGEPIDNDDDGEPVNNEFYSPFDQEIDPTGEARMYNGVLFAQY